MTSTLLGPLRWRLTAWYLLTLTLILVILGGGLFVVVRRQFAEELDESLQKAVAQLEQAAAVRERERGLPGPVADAVDELRIPDRRLFLLQPDGTPIRPEVVPDWVRALAPEAAARGSVTRDQPSPTDDELMFRLHANRFTVGSGPGMIAIAVADRVELEDRYASLITTFGLGALAGLLLVAIGGYLLVGQSIRPIEVSLEQQRRFMADAAHELRTPLSVLRGRAEVALQQPRDADTYVTALEGITAESGHLGRIVEDIFTLARVEAGERSVDRQRLFLDDVVLDAANSARVMAATKGVVMELAECEEAGLDGDPHLLRRLTMILLDNAIKFTAAGGRVTVRVGTVDGHPFLRVTDTGVGIPPEQLPHVVERFYRGDQARTRSVEGAGGAGLGLAIAQWIVSSHEATLRVTSELRVGTSVEVQFPRAEAVPG
jgi:signal transduction histidine kinase